MNLKLEQARGIIMWSEVMLHLQQQPTVTSLSPLLESEEPVTTSWIFKKIHDHHLFDLPGLQSNPIVAANLLWVVVRCKILILFSANHLLHPEQVYEIFDLFGWIDKRKFGF
jgi:hypothetical protein